MENHFAFLKNAKPAALFRLLEKLPGEDAALALAGLPPTLGIQAMAYFSESRQKELVPAIREARQAAPSRAAEAADRIRRMLLAARNAAPPPSPDRPSGGKPVPWVPRPADRSPINGPPLPGRPPSRVGDPLKSPLAGQGLLNLIGQAQERFLPRGKASSRPPGGRPAPREGVARSVEVSGPPRSIGPGPSRSPAGGARRMDGMAILGAIIRAADAGVRDNIRRGDPALFRAIRSRMFYFDDLVLTADADLARVFTAAPAREAALALQYAAPVLRDRVLGVVSPGRADALRTVPHGRSGLAAIEAAQEKVLAVALQLQAAGRILIDPEDPDLAGRPRGASD